MKATGMLKKLDGLNRIVLPKKITKGMGMKEGDYFDVYVEEGKIVLARFQPGCIFCGSTEHLKEHEEKSVCEDCITKMSRL